MTSASWPVIESRTEYETGWYEGGYDRVEQPDGSKKQYYWAALPPAVVIVARSDDQIIFVRQYRPTIKETQYELPAGIVDEHDGASHEPVDPADYRAAGRRELREETGYVADEVVVLQRYAVATGVLRHRRGIVFATDLTSGSTDRDRNEFMSVHRVPVEKAVTTARKQPTNDATINGLLLAKEEGLL